MTHCLYVEVATVGKVQNCMQNYTYKNLSKTVKQNLTSKHVAFSQSDQDDLIFDNLGSTVGIIMKSNLLNLN